MTKTGARGMDENHCTIRVEGPVHEPLIVPPADVDSAEADRCILVLFTPRSGSSWLTRIASATRQLGFLEEYINPDFIPEVSAAMRGAGPATLLSTLKRHAKTENGVFSMETRAVDIALFGETRFFEAFGPGTAIFLLWRDNIVAQGISLYRAVTTGRYHSNDPPMAPPAYDADEIAEWMRHIVETENENLALLDRRGLHARFMRYEDIVRDRRTALTILADAVRVTLTEAQRVASARAEPLKIADQWNLGAEQRFREERREFVRALEARRLIRHAPATNLAASREGDPVGSERLDVTRHPSGGATRWPYFGAGYRAEPPGTRYHSKFGGLWIDERDLAQVARRLTFIDEPVLRERVRRFARDGYVIIEQAVDHACIDAYLREFEQAANTPGAYLIEVPGKGGQQDFSRELIRVPGSKALDTAMLCPTGQDLCFAPKVAEFLAAVFGEQALAFQTLHFEVGSAQPIQQDTAYVVVKHEPLKLIAGWTALHDVRPGSGEPVYYIGGHRIPEYPYADGCSKHWNIQRDGHAPHDGHLRYLNEQVIAHQLEEGRFQPAKGDVLLWHADLPHGGSIASPGSLQRSLLTHYCPKSLSPFYLDFLPEDRRLRTPVRDGNEFVSMYFPPSRLGAMSSRPSGPGTSSQ